MLKCETVTLAEQPEDVISGRSLPRYTKSRDLVLDLSADVWLYVDVHGAHRYTVTEGDVDSAVNHTFISISDVSIQMKTR